VHIQLLKAVDKQAGDTASLVSIFLQRGADVNYTDAGCFFPLGLAAKNGDVVVTRLLCDAGANKDQSDESGATSLCIASQHGHADVVKVLYDAGANTDQLLKLLDDGTPDTKEHSARAIRSLATNADIDATLMKLGTGPKLLKLPNEGAPDAKEHAANAILYLADNGDNMVTLMTHGSGSKLLKLLEQLRSGTWRIQKTARSP
jgi:ankyrin repeat protein